MGPPQNKVLESECAVDSVKQCSTKTPISVVDQFSIVASPSYLQSSRPIWASRSFLYPAARHRLVGVSSAKSVDV